MKSIEVYRYRRKNRKISGDTGDSGDGYEKQTQAGQAVIDKPRPCFTPTNFKKEYLEELAEREAIRVVDGGADPDYAILKAALEIVARYGPACLLDAE